MSITVINHRSLTVHITGYDGLPDGTFSSSSSYKGVDFNPAAAIVKLLPLKLPAQHILNPSGVDIEIVGPESDGLPTTYAGAREMLKKLHQIHGATIDLWIHLGVGPWSFLTCERRAFRQDFTSSWLTRVERNDGYYLYPDGHHETVRDIGSDPWTHVPVGLHSEVPINDTVRKANASLQHVHEPDRQPLQVVTHLEGGPNGCGFAFYESMANCFTANRRRDVIFIHVPAKTDREDLEKARDGTLAIIGAAILAILDRNSKPPADLTEEFGNSR